MPDPEEPRSEPEEQIRDILSDLDRILEDLGPAEAAQAPAEPSAAQPEAPAAKPAAPAVPAAVTPPPAAAPVQEPPPSKPIEAAAPRPVETPPPSAPPAPQEPAAAPDEGLKIELAPRSGTLKPAPAPTDLKTPKPKPLASQSKPPLEIKLGEKEAEVAAKAPAPAEVAAPAALPADDIPADAGKDQIRRIAVLWSAGAEKSRPGFVKFLDESARTISKKPLYLRKVLAEPVSPEADDDALVEKCRAARAAAVLGLLEGFPEARLRELGVKFSRVSIVFRAVSAADLDKRATAVDIVVDLMLLGPEA